jgi:hypothetical protein
MKRGCGKEEPYFLDLDDSHYQSDSYSRDLRAIGQALESKNLLSFDLVFEGDGYVVRGKARPSASGGQSLVSGMCNLISSLLNGGSLRAKTDLELRFTTNEIHRMDDARRENRCDSNRAPDAYSLSQLLRGAGAYLDKQRKASLVGITLEERWVTLRYRTAEGRLEETKQDIEFFYNYWVKMYLQRRNRKAASALQS